MFGLKYVIAVVVCLLLADGTVAEKGDTFTSKMTRTGLPPGSAFVPPPAPKKKGADPLYVNGLITDGGYKKYYPYYLYSIDFPSETFPWTRVGLANTKLPGSQIFLNITYNTMGPTFFAYGNWSLNEIDNSLKANGLDMSSLADNSTYMITVMDEGNATSPPVAVGGVLISRPVAMYGNGSIGDSSGTESELVSDEVYVFTINNSTVTFTQGLGGFTNGYQPAPGDGVGIMQYVNGTYTWNLESTGISLPKAMQLRYFVDLGYQPVVAELIPDPPFPKSVNDTSEEGVVYSGNLTQAQIDQGIKPLGLDWATTNFNNTPNVYMITLTDHYNGTILGFVYNANEAPAPQPVIKGLSSAGRTTTSAVISVVIALILMLL